jgi:NAD(P)-dependent dehydrogenase (short-subunit alcohol dehydrogenase family)
MNRSDHTALVTGANPGLGRALAAEPLGQGATVSLALATLTGRTDRVPFVVRVLRAVIATAIASARKAGPAI